MAIQIKVALLFLLLIPCWVIGYHGVGDIGMYYSIAHFVKGGEFSRVYASNEGVGHFFYGPLSLVLFGWMPFLSYSSVRFAWVVLNTFAYILFWLGIHRLFPYLKNRNTRWLWVFVWLSSIKAIHASFQSHNVQLIIAALLVWCELLSERKSPLARFFCGWLPTFAAEVKIFPFLMSLFTFLRGSRLVRIGIIMGGFVGLLLPVVWFGWGNAVGLYRGFIENLNYFHDYAPLTKDAVTLSLASLIATWFSPTLGMETCLLLNKILGFIIASSVLAYGYLRRNSKDQRERIHLFSLTLAVMALVNSSTRPDYFIFFVPAFAAISEFWQTRRLPTIGIVGSIVALLLIDFISEWTLQSRELNHQLELMRLPVVGMIGLCTVLFLVVNQNLEQNLGQKPGQQAGPASDRVF